MLGRLVRELDGRDRLADNVGCRDVVDCAEHAVGPRLLREAGQERLVPLVVVRTEEPQLAADESSAEVDGGVVLVLHLVHRDPLRPQRSVDVVRLPRFVLIRIGESAAEPIAARLITKSVACPGACTSAVFPYVLTCASSL